MSKSTRARRHRRLRMRRENTLRTAPGTIKPDPSCPRPAMHVIHYGPDHAEERDLTRPEEVRPCLEKPGVTWLNVDGLGDAATIRSLGEIFGLHPLALEDVVNTNQRPKIEEYEDHLFVVAHMMSAEDEQPYEQLSLFLGKNFVVTFQERPGGDTFEPVRRRIRKGHGRVRSAGADYLAYSLLDSIVDGYFPILEQLSNRIDDAESRAAGATGSQVFEDIHSIRNELLMVRRAVWPLRDALSAIVREPHAIVRPETRVFLRDCYDHTVQIIDLAEVYRELCSDLRDYLLTIISQRTNDIMRVLTIIATIFIPLGFIAGLYGMNFDTRESPWNMPELKWSYGYPFALALMAAVAVGLLYFFKRKGWIGEKWFKEEGPLAAPPGKADDPAKPG